MTIFTDLADRFAEIHGDLLKAVDGLPGEALDWIPGKEMNSINVLVTHLVASQKYWIDAVALGEPTNRVREEEFKVQGIKTEDLRQLILDANASVSRSLARFSLGDLETSRKSPRNDRIFSIGWCLLHALEHSALHLGHIQLTRQLWEQRSK